MMDETRATERPEGLIDEYLEWLDWLRIEGSTNMWGAAPFLARAFGLDGETASTYTIYWMKTFSERHPEDH